MIATTRPTDARYQASLRTRVRFVARVVGLTALLVMGIGFMLLASIFTGSAPQSDSPTWTIANVMDAASGKYDSSATWGAMLLFIGAGLLLAAVVYEMFTGFWFNTNTRTTAGTFSVIQIVLATVLLVGVNIYSFSHYQRIDLTRDKQFTLPADIVEQLKQLRDPTTILVLLQHKTFGRLSDKPDAYDYAAERKIVEKVKDLATQFTEFGPQFRVVVLDVEADGFEEKLKAITKDNPELLDAIEVSSENSIFFTSKGKKVQRLSFNQFYQLDKNASNATAPEERNLVLLPQGLKAFTQRIFSIEEKRPRVGLAVIHELLTTRGSRNELTMRGLREALENNGFEVVDIVLKRWGRGGPPEAAAYTYDENRLDAVEADVEVIKSEIANGKDATRNLVRSMQLFQTATLEELSKAFARQLRGRPMTEALREQNLTNMKLVLGSVDEQLREFQQELVKLEQEQAKLTSSEATVEGRRISDVREKFDSILDTCDMLIVPRLTILNLVDGDMIPNRLYKLDKGQVASVRAFMAAGRPVMALFGPGNEPEDTPPDADPTPDQLQELLGQLGIVFGKQTIIYNVESKAFAERRSNPLGGGNSITVPPLDFDTTATGGQINPVREAMRITRRSVGRPLDLSLRYPQPVYFQSIRPLSDEYQAEFLFTDATAWNESKPFPSADYTPKYDVRADDPMKGTLDEERRGPFSIGVALATTVPADWVNAKYAAQKVAAMVGLAPSITGGAFPGILTAQALLSADRFAAADPAYKLVPLRVIAIGQGSLFNSPVEAEPTLSPAREELLLTSTNWLLGRDERLPNADTTWEYPRVQLSERHWLLWRWGMFLGLPVLVAYIGLIVLMIRKLR